MAADKFRIDSHKLIYHPERVAAWLRGDNISPIYLEMALTGTCNHRCVFCSVDFTGYHKVSIPTPKIMRLLEELADMGLKSIMFAGEGEPFLNPDAADIAVHAKECGIDVAFTTNGVLMGQKTIEKAISVSEWIKVSCNAGTKELYAKMHRCKMDDFDRVFANLSSAVEYRSKIGSRCVLGIQAVLLPDNAESMEALAKRSSALGIDYLVVKPYMPHHLNKHHYEIKYSEYKHLEDTLKRYETETFKVIYRVNAMSKWDHHGKSYRKCLALPFWSYIDADGNVWGCSVYMNDERFLYGNIKDASFKEIWNGEKRKDSLAFVDKNFCMENCKITCRMDEVNLYLWELQHSPAHVNFI